MSASNTPKSIEKHIDGRKWVTVGAGVYLQYAGRAEWLVERQDAYHLSARKKNFVPHNELSVFFVRPQEAASN